jgi:chemosensory pili system protein ChpA (sensor histidine kinase/response regulator)
MLNARTRATIMVLCSDAVVMSVFRDTLEKANYLVVPAHDLGDAVDRLRETPPDLLIVRAYLDSISGHDAARYLRTKQHGLPVLIATGYIDDDRIAYRELLTSFEIFPAPYTAADFLAKVQQVLSENPPAK